MVPRRPTFACGDFPLFLQCGPALCFFHGLTPCFFSKPTITELCFLLWASSPRGWVFVPFCRRPAPVFLQFLFFGRLSLPPARVPFPFFHRSGHVFSFPGFFTDGSRGTLPPSLKSPEVNPLSPIMMHSQFARARQLRVPEATP